MNCRLRTLGFCVLISMVGCAQKTEIESEKPYEKTNEIVDVLNLSALTSDTIRIIFAPYPTDSLGNEPSYVEDHFHLEIQQQCYDNCARNDIDGLKQILSNAEPLKCIQVFYTTKISFLNDAKSNFDLYVGNSPNFIRFEEKCYFLQKDLEPLVSTKGHLYWTEDEEY